mmetsp:Transcript_156593/g.502666  ORF Transcript_156593/g.502666 Transcript_156593/m.502666 type:complete len:823 (-) Transcript_156593:364-2832(-)
MGLFDDDDEVCGMDTGKQTICVGCTGCCSVIGFITFCVIISAYHHLGPDEQLVVRRGKIYVAVNGPWSGQMNPFESKTRRQALKLEATQYAKVLDKKTNTYRVVVGPYFEFLKADENVVDTSEKIVLARDEYVVLINKLNGQERVVKGPMMLYENVTDNFKAMRLVKKIATYLDEETAAVIANKNTAGLSLVTHCSGTDTLYVPPPNIRVVEERKLTFVKPNEVLVVRDEDGRTQFYDGSNPSTVVAFQCPSAASSEPGGGLAFWLPPYSRIIRMVWSDYSTPVEGNGTTIVASSAVASASPRRRRTSRNIVVNKQIFSSTPQMWLVAGDYNKDTKLWINRGSGPNLTNLVTKGTVMVSSSVGGGPSANLMSINGNTGTTLSFGNLLASSSWTICSLTRYAGTTRREILQGTDWFHGHYGGHTGVARYGLNSTQVLVDVVEPTLEWVPMCGSSGGPTPDNILVGDEAVGEKSGGSTPSGIYVNQNTLSTSDFAIAEIITWTKVLSKDEKQEAMDYLMERLDDAKTYMDQASSLGEKTQIRYVTAIDTRMQRSFYKFEVRSKDNVKLLLEGTVYWAIKDARRAVNGTADPEGDVWFRARSTLIGAISAVNVNDFMQRLNTIIEDAFNAEKGDTFYSDRGIELINLDVLSYTPMDSRTIKSLNTLIKTKTERMVALGKQRTENEVRALKIDGDVRLAANKTQLIEAQALNDKLEAETRGATEGGRKATTINEFLNGVKYIFPDTAKRVKLYREHIIRNALAIQTQHLFTGKAKVFLKPKGQNLTLMLPTDVGYALPDERRLKTKTGASNPANPSSAMARHVHEL